MASNRSRLGDDMRILIFIIFIFILVACANEVYTKTKFCIVCWEQTVDTASNVHDEKGNIVKAKLQSNKASEPTK